MVRPPAPRDHPPACVRYRLPRAPETWTPFTHGCMTSEPHSTRFERAPGAFSEFSGCSGLVGRMEGDDGAAKIRRSIAICESGVG
eukprot:scaffold23607_cov59-Phaeocystis_antarctica.AAC.1